MIDLEFSKKPRYNLNVVVQETGVKADTLRAWERRYDLPRPSRTEGGHRLYSDHDIRTIKWLQSRLDEGMRISQAADYWQDLVAAGSDPLQQVPPAMVPEPLSGGEDHGSQTLADLQARWIDSILKFNEPAAEQVLTQAFAQFPIEIVCTNLISAALAQIGQLWLEGNASVQQEHFASELATKKLQSLITSAPKPHHNQRILLACPPGEYHTIPILMINLMLRYRGWEVLYLGANVPAEKLAETVLETHPDLAVFSASRLPSAAALVQSVQLLREYQIPSAFGGWIFTQIEALISRIPAHYMGENLHNSILLIERLLANPSFSTIQAPAVDQVMLTDYIDNQPLLEHRALAYLNQGANRSLHQDDLRDANEQFSQNIMAALYLGSIDLISTDPDWVRVLLSHRGLPEDLHAKHFRAYTKAAREVLGDHGQPIITWLESALEKMQSSRRAT